MNNEIEELEQKLADMLEQNLTLYSMLYETLEKQGCENVASTIDQMTAQHLEEQANWYKGNKRSEELNTRLVEEMELSAERRQIIEDLTLENRVLADELKKKDERIAELEDKDWYEALIKQLEEQNERLINDRENSKKAIVDLTDTCDKRDDNYKKLQEQIIAKLRKRIQEQIIFCGAKATERDIIEANSYNGCIADIIKILDEIQKTE